MLNFRTLTSFLVGLFLLPFVAFADLTCDGTDDKLVNGTTLDNFISASTGTLTIWYKPTGTASYGTNCDEGEALFGELDYLFGIYRHGNQGGVHSICAFNYSGGNVFVDGPQTSGTWVHIAFVHTGGNIILYLNGASVDSDSSGNSTTLTSPLELCDNVAAWSFPGEGVMAYPQVFPTALSAGEIAAVGKSQLFRVGSSAPSGSWELGSCNDGASCDTQVFADGSGNARTFTATGTTGTASAYLSYPWGVE